MSDFCRAFTTPQVDYKLQWPFRVDPYGIFRWITGLMTINRMQITAVQHQVPAVAAHIPCDQFIRAEMTPSMLAAAQDTEERFHLRFDRFTVFSKSALAELHQSQTALPPNVDIVSRRDPSLPELVDALTRVANLSVLDTPNRRIYYHALLDIYRRLPLVAEELRAEEKTLVVGIEREGRILAEALNCMPPGRSLRPHAKRIWFKRGLMVGFTDLSVADGFSKCVIIDGAIASGSTLIALIERLRPSIPAFQIYSAHATQEGLHALARYAVLVGIDLHIAVGHATSGLNEHFYAVRTDNPDLLVVGDLGDTISPLLDRDSPPSLDSHGL